ncbi:hypothetical protein L1987_22024 [Smallanthus sonchifolius]|uniref:Uncharacterized protein n=1 Tax=Smallanthus sonchifolius TaxID=185202 RepID=A0ACB9IF67_9ASTR|nr:hypothetical protein L1987_22024 [Smallanthus sonchifolius]
MTGSFGPSVFQLPHIQSDQPSKILDDEFYFSVLSIIPCIKRVRRKVFNILHLRLLINLTKARFSRKIISAREAMKKKKENLALRDTAYEIDHKRAVLLLIQYKDIITPAKVVSQLLASKKQCDSKYFLSQPYWHSLFEVNHHVAFDDEEYNRDEATKLELFP